MARGGDHAVSDERSGGHLYWTNAWTSDVPSEWAWWQLDFEQAGEYLVEVWVDDTFGVYDNVRYEIVADGQSTVVHLDQGSASGWAELGAFQFAQGGRQYVAVYDNTTQSVPSDQHIVVDAVSLTRVDAYCGDGACDAGEDCFGCPEDCPAVTEIPDNGVDDDCDGEVDEAPSVCGDGTCEAGEDCFGCPEDCPAVAEIPDNGVDDDCDGVVDEDATDVPGADAGPSGSSTQGGCGCTATGSPPGFLLVVAGLVLGLALRRRRRRGRRPTDQQPECSGARGATARSRRRGSWRAGSRSHR